ncbi:MAG: Fic family protein [Bacteroidetes bacterium]|nr:Fic family protein [Bacteroidota bacterium]
MYIRDFISGKQEKQYQYRSFLPNPVNHAWITADEKLDHMLSRANICLGELNAFSSLVPDVDYFIRMHVQKEALTSSRIEGTRTRLEEALQKEEYIDPERRDDWQEVRNYVLAMNTSIESLSRLPISGRIIRQAHKVLLQGVRGEHKQPGEYRQSQNWVGGSSIQDALFIPPHHTEVPELMSDLEKFLNNEDLMIPDLIRIGIAHYQFETIHPFLDGNGRIGRLIITLFLVSRKVLTRPVLYLSDFLEKNRVHYYDRLTRARVQNDLAQWLIFFLEGVRQTAENSIITFRKIIDMRQRLETHDMPKLGKKAPSGMALLRLLYSQPVVDGNDVAEMLNVNISTALRMISDFEKLGILQEMTGYRRNRVFIFGEYVSLFG